MTFKSMPARQRTYPIPIGFLEEGDFVIYAEQNDTAHMVYRPPESKTAYSARLTTDREKQDRVGLQGTYWWWNGDKKNPTLKPSIGVPATEPYAWHGWLTNGQWKGC